MQTTQSAELFAKSGLAHAQNASRLGKQEAARREASMTDIIKDRGNTTMPSNMTSGPAKVTTNSTTNDTIETEENVTAHSNLTLNLVSAKTIVDATVSHDANATESHDVNATESHDVNATGLHYANGT